MVWFKLSNIFLPLGDLVHLLQPRAHLVDSKSDPLVGVNRFWGNEYQGLPCSWVGHLHERLLVKACVPLKDNQFAIIDICKLNKKDSIG